MIPLIRVNAQLIRQMNRQCKASALRLRGINYLRVEVIGYVILGESLLGAVSRGLISPVEFAIEKQLELQH